MTSAVLDASALLAYLTDEPGAEVVETAIAAGATMSSVNLAEVLVRLDPAAPETVDADLRSRGLLGGGITIEPLTHSDAVEIARLRQPTRSAGLSLADRACLALAHRLAVPALTADQAWRTLQLPAEVQMIRSGSHGRLGDAG